MSHYVNLKTKIVDEKALVRALGRMGFKEEDIECHSQPTNLYGYQGDMRKDKANVILRRKFVGTASNDIGFIKNANGTYEAIISDYDRNSRGYNQDWLRKLSTYYGVEKSKKEFEARGLKYFEDTDENNRPRLRVLYIA